MKRKQIGVGGQAVIEGVMMRGPENLATAIRRKDKSIEIKKTRFISKTKYNKFLGFPIIRGFVSLIEMMIIGIKTLNFSVSRAELDWEDEKPKKNKKEKSKLRIKFEETISYAFAFGLAFLLFAYLPYQIAEWMNLAKENVYFNLFAGFIRIIFFVLYVWIISKMKDVNRIFEYHGAEHKSVFAYEANSDLDADNVQKFTTFHPRCGTSFIFFVLLISILIFSIVDTLVAKFLLGGNAPNIFLRLSYHFFFMPFISGISYEVLKLSSKNIKHPLVKLMTAPGLALQRITTQPPDNEQIEVAVIAMKCALEMDLSEYKNISFIDDE
ncbi:MAG: DUF1385 domain-containing protein [Candidatus Tenebribacter burtonii]|nr:DUF1385 domain-containing protein [Candidatus Tenebribacter burtonii]